MNYLQKTGTMIIALMGLMAGLASADVSHTCSFTASDLTIQSQTDSTTGNIYQRFDLPGCFLKTGTIGAPELPYKTIRLLLPANEKATELAITNASNHVVAGSYAVYPAQPRKTIGDDEAPQFVPPDQAWYSSTTPYPGKIAEIEEEGYLGLYHIVTIRLYPVQYTPSAQAITFYDNISLAIKTTGSVSRAVPVGRQSKIVQDENQKLVRSLIQNPQNMASFGPVIKIGKQVAKDGKIIPTAMNVKALPNIDDIGVDYVIITSEAIKTCFEPLADWKTQKGVKTQIRTVEWIDANYTGCDIQEKIRNFIKDAYSLWGTGYVLLAGDTRLIPARILIGVPSDMYYANLEGNWNANGNQIFGETSSDGVDRDDEVSLGRAAVETVIEAQNFVNKVLQYEQNPDPDYLTKMLFLGTGQHMNLPKPSSYDAEQVQLAYPTGAGLTDEFKQNKYELYSPAVDPDPLNDPPWWSGDATLNKDNVVNAMNSGYHLIWHVDHCSQYTLGTGININNSFQKLMNRVDVEDLANDNKPFIMWTNGCDPNDFTYENISESFMKSINKGAIGLIGNSIVGYDFYNYMGLNFFTSLFYFNNYRLGNAFRSIPSNAGSYLYGVYNQNLLGDPEMPVWKTQPQTLVVEHPANIIIGQNSVTVTVLDNNYIPVEGALVCLQKGYEAYAIGSPDAIGQVTFDYTPETIGEFSITVTAQNYKPYQGVCAVLPSAVGYICYDNSQFDDDNENLTQGNSDGILNPGETADMWLSIKNTGGAGVLKAAVSLTTDDPYITPKTFSTETYKVYSNTTKYCDYPCKFTIAANCPDQHNIVFHMTSNACSDSFVVKVLADSLVQTGHNLIELTGDGDGVIDPGERIQISDLQVTNFGSGAADGATAQLITADPYLTIETGLSAVGAIAADGIVTEPNGFIFSVSPSAPSGRLYVFTLTLKDRFNRQWVQNNFELVPTVAPTGLMAASTVEGILLNWTALSGAVGYNVYRSTTAGGPYTKSNKINRHAVKQSSYYLDEDVSPQNPYYYKVTALDASANESGFSNEASIYTPLSYKAGWPVVAGTRGGYNWSSAIPGDIDGNGYKEVVLGTNDGHLYVLRHDGNSVNNWPKDFGTAYVSTALGDVDKCGLPEIVAGVCNEGILKVYIYKNDGSLLAENSVYTGTIPDIESAISIADVDRNGWLNIILMSKGTATIYNYEWNSATSTIDQIWSYTVPGGSPMGIAVGDINADDCLEIVFGTWTSTGDVYAIDHDGVMLWKKSLNGGVCSAPSIGDVNNDGKNEIVIVSSSGSGNCFVRDGNGDPLYSFAAGGQVWGSLALADFERNGTLDIVAGIHKLTYGFLSAWRFNGTPRWALYRGIIHSSPAVVDVNNDGLPEIFDGCYAKGILGCRYDSQTLECFPIPTGDNTYSSPFIADLDGNGSAELGIDMNDGKIHAWEIPGTADPTPDWPMPRHDAMNSGTYGWLNEFSGHITRDLTLSGDNFFNGDVVIDENVTVTLKPNARMYFMPSGIKNLGIDPRCEVIVNGTLIVQGTAGDSVRFMPWTTSPTPGTWYGIRVEAGGNVQLDYCVIENAATGIQAVGSSPQITNSRIQGCYTGIYCNNSSAQIKNNRIVDNGPLSKSSKGLFKASADSFASKGLDSASCIGTGIVALNSNITLDNNIIRNNYTGYYGGGNIQGDITNNTFEDNEYQGMDLYGTAFNMTITGNNFYRNAIPLNGTNGWEWAGISIGYRDISTTSSINIESNTFTGNHAGARCTRYGEIIPAATFNLTIRDNNFTTSNEVGLKIATDISPNLTAIATGNYFTGNTIYGVCVYAVNGCPLSLGDLGNASADDNGSNRLFNNGSYDVYCAVPAPIAMKAEGNFWNKRLASQVDARIYDDNENPSFGPVDFQPFYIWEWDKADAVWSGIVSIAGDVVVPPDGTLKIEPGTVVRFISNFDAAAGGNDPAKAELIIYGQLELKGKPGEPPVIFQSDAYKPQAGDWGGIIFSQPTGSSKSAESKGIITRDMKNCIVRHAVSGISIDGDLKLELKQCKLEQNTAGISFYDQATAECKDDTIANNNTGIACNGYSTPLFKNSFISQNKNNGIVINDNAQPNFGDDEECGHNIISSNLPYNLYNATSNNIMAKKNYWGTMNVDTVAKYIFDGNDQSGLGIVSYLPLWDGPKDTHHGTQLETSAMALPTTFSLLQNAPNPMVGFTAINFAVAKPGNVSLKIYNISGQLVKTLVNENKQQGYYNVRWDGKDESGQQAAAGVYFYRIQANEYNNTKKLVILK